MRFLLFSLLLFIFACRHAHFDSAANLWEDTKDLASRAVNLTSKAAGRAWSKTKDWAADKANAARDTAARTKDAASNAAG